jgi:predicted  nucleic acid-binding Zn-ribbon protein
MHVDLALISNLWSVDSAMDKLRAEHDSLSGAVRSAVTTLASCEAEVLAATAARDKVVVETRTNDRELAGYVEQRNKTRTMINTGTAPDYAAAERQLAQVLAIVDQLETRSLELMEQLDAATAAKEAAEKERAKAQESLAAARAALGVRDGPIRVELTALIAKQKIAAAELPSMYRTDYGEQRRRKRPGVTTVGEAGTCTNCGMKARPQHLIEVQLARAVHACSGCGAWFLP